MGRREEAIKLLEEATSVAPTVWLNWMLLGSMLSNSERNEEALQAYDCAASCNDVNIAEVNYNQALVLKKLGKLTEALEILPASRLLFDEAIHMHIQALRLELLNQLGRHEEVLSASTAIEEFENDKHDAADLGHYDIAVEATQWAGTANTAIADAWVAVATARRALQQDYSAVLSDVRRAFALHTSDEALLLIRDVRNLHSPTAKAYKMTVTGQLMQDTEPRRGFFRNYLVLSDTPEEALQFIGELEPETVTMDSCELSNDDQYVDVLTGTKGVYWVSRYFTFPEN
ncbi:MAG: hypothetical protein ACR2IE_13490 [Candidatus Sumerlaeaceae bacterium]